MTCRSRDACGHHDTPTGKGWHRATALARLQPKRAARRPISRSLSVLHRQAPARPALDRAARHASRFTTTASGSATSRRPSRSSSYRMPKVFVTAADPSAPGVPGRRLDAAIVITTPAGVVVEFAAEVRTFGRGSPIDAATRGGLLRDVGHTQGSDEAPSDSCPRQRHRKCRHRGGSPGAPALAPEPSGLPTIRLLSPTRRCAGTSRLVESTIYSAASTKRTT